MCATPRLFSHCKLRAISRKTVCARGTAWSCLRTGDLESNDLEGDNSGEKVWVTTGDKGDEERASLPIPIDFPKMNALGEPGVRDSSDSDRGSGVVGKGCGSTGSVFVVLVAIVTGWASSPFSFPGAPFSSSCPIFVRAAA